MEATLSPTFISLSRKGFPNLSDSYAENKCKKGGHVIREASKKARVTLIAIGYEVFIAFYTKKNHKEAEIPTFVVSMAITELFDEQTKEYYD